MHVPRDDKTPQLVADLSLFSAADALQWARSSLLTGRLTFRNESGRIALLFDKGHLIYAESRDRRAAFGRHVFAEGLVDEVDLAAATVYGRDNQKRLGAVMVELGILSKTEVKPELHEHTLNLASMPLAWTGGTVSAESSDSEVMPVVMTDPVDPTHLLMEAARRVDRTRSMRVLLPNDDLLLAPEATELADDASPRDLRVIEVLGLGASIDELYDRIGGAYFQFLESVHRLVEQGAIAVLEATISSEESVAPAATSGESEGQESTDSGPLQKVG